MHMNAIRPRVARLRQLFAELGQECTRWKEDQGLLLPGEKRAYLHGLQAAIAGADEAAVVLEKAIRRWDSLNHGADKA